MNSTDPDIKRFINREILPRLERMTEVREEHGRLFYVSAMVSTVVVVGLVGAYGFNVGVEEMGLVDFGIVLAAVVAYGAALHGVFHLVFVRGQRRDYVDQIVAPLVDRVRSGVDYSADRAAPREIFEESGLAQLPVDRYKSRDRFTANLSRGVVEFSEVIASSRVRPQGQKFAPKRTCFLLRGLFFSADVESLFRGTTIITPTLRRFANASELPRVEVPGAEISAVVRPAEDWPHLNWTPELHGEPVGEVTIPDPEFAALFDVYSTQVAETRAFLSSQVVEKLKRAYEVWRSPVHRTALTDTEGAGHFTIVLHNGHLYLARPMPRTLFEIRAFPSGEQAELLLQFARDVRLGLEVVRALSHCANPSNP